MNDRAGETRTIQVDRLPGLNSRGVSKLAAPPNANARLGSTSDLSGSSRNAHGHIATRRPHRFAPFMAKVAARLGMSDADSEALLAIARSRQVAKGEFVTSAGSRTSALLFLCSGNAYSVRNLEDGSQQIVAVFVPGDLLNPSDLMLRSARASICVSTSAVVLEVPHTELLSLLTNRPAIIRALWCETALQAAIQREWMIWLGRRSAQARLAHFLCELSYRTQQWSGSPQETVAFPFAQRELADALGLSYVHINRVLQQLRSMKLIELAQGRLTIRSRELYAIAEFDPGYLQISIPADPLLETNGTFEASDIRARR